MALETPSPLHGKCQKKFPFFFQEHFPQHNEILLHITTKIQPCKKEYRSQLKQQEHRLDVDNVTTMLIDCKWNWLLGDRKIMKIQINIICRQ